MTRPNSNDVKAGFRIARGVMRELGTGAYASIDEFTVTKGKRVDVFAISPKGEIWIIECKSSRADYMTDQKWRDYLPFCDRFYWAVPPDFPIDILPSEGGIFIADDFGAEQIRGADLKALSAACRKTLTLKMARTAADRLRALKDPKPRYE